MKSKEILSTLSVMAGYSVSESDRRFSMKPSDPPGINAHSCAPDAAVEWLADLGFDPESWSEEALRLASQFIEVGYCLGSAAADERHAEDMKDMGGDLAHTENILREARAEQERLLDYNGELLAERNAFSLDLTNTAAEVTRLQGELGREIERVRALQVENSRMREKLLKIENILS